MKKTTMVVIVAAFCIVAFYWYTPIRTVHRFKDALRAGDSETLDEIIDFESVRENLKTDLRARREENLRDSNNPLASLGLTIGGALADGVVDAFVTPSGLAAVLHGRNPTRDASAGEPMDDDIDFDIDRHPLKFRAKVELEQRSDLHPVLDFALRGIHWRVVRLELHRSESKD